MYVENNSSSLLLIAIRSVRQQLIHLLLLPRIHTHTNANIAQHHRLFNRRPLPTGHVVDRLPTFA